MLHGMVEIARMCVMKAAKTSNVMYTLVNVNMVVVIRIDMELIVQVWLEFYFLEGCI